MAEPPPPGSVPEVGLELFGWAVPEVGPLAGLPSVRGWGEAGQFQTEVYPPWPFGIRPEGLPLLIR